jgi:hypothetical protein
MTPEQYDELIESVDRLQASLAEMAKNLGSLGHRLEGRIRGDQLVFAIRQEQKRRGKGDPFAA